MHVLWGGGSGGEGRGGGRGRGGGGRGVEGGPAESVFPAWLPPASQERTLIMACGGAGGAGGAAEQENYIRGTKWGGGG